MGQINQMSACMRFFFSRLFPVPFILAGVSAGTQNQPPAGTQNQPPLGT